MMKRLILATRNRGKVKELEALLEGLPLEIICLDRLPSIPPVEEDQSSISGNALKKASTVARACGEAALADDSGLVVDALDGLPGVHSARFAGRDAGDAANNSLLLEKLRGLPPEKRAAAFRCAVALVFPDGKHHLIEESCRGRIAETPRGSAGFGYDPLFFYEPAGLTFAQMDVEAKNRVSHRGKALRKARRLLEQLLP